jgi:hypothetical protein
MRSWNHQQDSLENKHLCEWTHNYLGLNRIQIDGIFWCRWLPSNRRLVHKNQPAIIDLC